MAASSPWGVSMDLSGTATYTHTACVKCLTATGTEVSDNTWLIEGTCPTLPAKSSPT